ncbi:MAG: hypothetical protein Ct9H300mP1_13690 [Planctomycetaceae bacterium]|nr:MAG: hypothetical protein Ct9H300mP1_13690 [Planctomycetaceae bacterium]
MIPYWPVTPQQRRKYGRFMHSHRPGVRDMARMARAYKIPPGRNNVYLYSHTSSKVVNAMLGVRRALLEYKQGGRPAMLRYHSYPTKFTPDQYLQARIDAAKRVLDYRRRSLAVDWGDRPFNTGITGWKDFGWVSRKETWYARDGAFRTSGPWSGTVWHQWQFVYDKKLALGKIDADAVARGGEAWRTPPIISTPGMCWEPGKCPATRRTTTSTFQSTGSPATRPEHRQAIRSVLPIESWKCRRPKTQQFTGTARQRHFKLVALDGQHFRLARLSRQPSDR